MFDKSAIRATIERIRAAAVEDPETAYRGFEARRWNGRELRGACPLHHGENKDAFSVKDGHYRCFTRCPDGRNHGDAFTFRNGGEQPRGRRFLEVAAELGRDLGIDVSALELTPAARRRRIDDPANDPPYDPQALPPALAAAVAEQAAEERRAAREKINDRGAQLGECLGRYTRAAFDWLRCRLPGLVDEDLEQLADAGWIGSPAAAKDQGDRAGAYQLGRYGYGLLMPMRSLDDPAIISGGQVRWTKAAEDGELEPAPEGKKTRQLPGRAGGRHGAVFGRLDLAIAAADRYQRPLIVTEGDADTLTVAALGVEELIGVAGAGRAAAVVRALIDRGWRGRVTLALDRDPPDPVTGRPGAGDVALLAAARVAEGTGIEIIDGRPPLEGQDLNNIFRAAGGGGAGARAVMELLESAPLFEHPELAEERRAAKERAAQQRAQVAAAVAGMVPPLAVEERADPDAAPQLDPADITAALHRLDEASRQHDRSPEERADVLEAAACLLSSDYLPLPPAGRRRAFELFSEGDPERGRACRRAIAELERCHNKAPDGSEIGAAARYLERLVGLAGAALVIDLANATGAPALELLALLGFVHSTHRVDKAWLEAARIGEDGRHRVDPSAKKTEALELCGSFEREHRLEDTGEQVRQVTEVCSAGECPFCQLHYLREMTSYLRSPRCPGWSGRYLLGFVEAPSADPAGVEAAFYETEHLLRLDVDGDTVDGFRAFKCIDAPELGERAGVLFVAELDAAGLALRSFERVMRGSLEERDAAGALERIARSQAALALRTGARIAARDADVTLDPWLGRTTMALHRGDVSGLPWLAIRPWKKLRRELLGDAIDERPQWITVRHRESDVVIDERHSSTPPAHHHEIIRLAHENGDLAIWLDAEARRQLPAAEAERVYRARRLAREARRRRAPEIEEPDQPVSLDPRALEYAEALLAPS